MGRITRQKACIISKIMEKERDFWKGKCAELENLVQKIHGITEARK